MGCGVTGEAVEDREVLTGLPARSSRRAASCPGNGVPPAWPAEATAPRPRRGSAARPCRCRRRSASDRSAIPAPACGASGTSHGRHACSCMRTALRPTPARRPSARAPASRLRKAATQTPVEGESGASASCDQFTVAPSRAGSQKDACSRLCRRPPESTASTSSARLAGLASLPWPLDAPPPAASRAS